jgi:hypothetical protein
MSKNKRSKDQEVTVSLSKGHKQSDVRTPPKDSRMGNDYIQIEYVVSLLKNDLPGKKKQKQTTVRSV